MTAEKCEFMYGNGNEKTVPELVEAAAMAYGSNAHGVKYIFPCAPPARKNGPPGYLWYQYYYPTSSPQWPSPKSGAYNGYYSTDAYLWQSDNDHINMDQWTEIIGWMKNLVLQEIEILGDASKVIVGGNSQGGTVAIDVGLTNPKTLGGLLCLRTCPMRETLGPVPARPLEGVTDGTNLKGANLEMPIFCYIDGRDDIYIPPLQHRNYNLIQNRGYVVTTKVDPTAHHETNEPAENRWAATWIAEAFFAKSRSSVFSQECMPLAQADPQTPQPSGWSFFLCGSKPVATEPAKARAHVAEKKQAAIPAHVGGA
jgi:predicted esterase